MKWPSEERPGEGASKLSVDEHRRLWTQEFEQQTGWEEYFDSNMRSRVLSLPVDHPDAIQHARLAETRLPVFSAVYSQERLLLLVPEGTRQLRRILRFIARDIVNYSEILSETGEVLEQVKEEGIGLPAYGNSRQLLDSLAYSPDEGNFYGGKLYLVPPYHFDVSLTPLDMIGELDIELEASGYFSATGRGQLIQKVISGWEQQRSRSA